MKTPSALIVCTLSLVLAACGKPKDADYNKLDYDQKEGLSFFMEPGSKEGFTGIAKNVDKSGKVVAEFPMKKGHFHGKVREWYPNGQLKSETAFSNGRRHGKNTEWKENGEIYNERVYEQNKIVSENTPPAKN